MTQTQTREQPVISFTSGLTCVELIDFLVDTAQEMLKWRNENMYKSPERLLSSVPAYKVAILQELIFTSRVGTHDLCNRLAETNPAGYMDAQNYELACEEVAAIVKTLEG